MLLRWLDYSWARPSPDAMYAAGYSAVFRYLGPDQIVAGRDLSPDEVTRLHRAGLAIGLFWETSAQRALTGRQGGRLDAVLAMDHANRIGAPAHVPILATCDFDASDAQLAGPVRDYFTAWAETTRRPFGLYGHYDCLEALVPRLAADHPGYRGSMQCAGWSGNGYGTGGSIMCLDGSYRRVSQYADLYQDVRGPSPWVQATDLIHVLTNDPWRLVWRPDHTEPDEMPPSTITCPDHTQDAVWAVTTDGFGRLRRERIPTPPTHAALIHANVYGPNVELHGELAERFLADIKEANPDWHADDAALALTMRTMAHVTHEHELDDDPVDTHPMRTPPPMDGT